jgi:hypothetical protein
VILEGPVKKGLEISISNTFWASATTFAVETTAAAFLLSFSSC